MVFKTLFLLIVTLAATVIAGNFPLNLRQESASATGTTQSISSAASRTRTLPNAPTSTSTLLVGDAALCKYVALSVSAIIYNMPNANSAFATLTPTAPIPPPSQSAAFCSVIFSDLPANATVAARQYQSLIASWVNFYSTGFSSLQSCATAHPADEMTSIYEDAAFVTQLAQCRKSGASSSGKRGTFAAAGIAAAIAALCVFGMS